MSDIVNLKPEAVWRFFDEITRIPRPSKKEEKIVAYLIDFAKSRSLEYRKDSTGNVVIRKGASPGMENRPVVVLQSHVDMVCEKRGDVNFHFVRTRYGPASKTVGCVPRVRRWVPTAESAWRPSWPCWMPTIWHTVRSSVFSPSTRRPA